MEKKQNKILTLGSLFDGSGGFPLGAKRVGITPIWASEIEPFPIRVTTKRLPSMKHYGDISKINGGDIEPVDIITFGSPCQDMSIAGKREGLSGSKSSLFYEAIRIIKEMREKTNGKYPRFIVWENVTGAFSSNKGEDFRVVLEEIGKIKDKSMFIPKPKKWSKSGSIVGYDYSIAWRQLDAQFWGVPQRRKRIYLIADFTGWCAGKILFESEGLFGDSKKSIYSWERTSTNSEESTGESSNSLITPKTLKIRCGCEGGGKGVLIQDNKTATLSRNNDQVLFQPVAYGIGSSAINQGDNARFDFQIEEEVEPSIVSSNASGVSHAICNKSNELSYIVRRLTPTECARLQGFPDWWCENLETENPSKDDIQRWREIFQTYAEAMKKKTKPKSDKQIIKWLKNPRSDTAEYKMWGNGVALPNVVFVLNGIKEMA